MTEYLATTAGRFIRSSASTFATARIGGGTIDVIAPTFTNPDYLQGARYDLTASHFLYRAFLFFDLSSLTVGRTISGSPTLDLYIYSVDSEDDANSNVIVCEGQQSSTIVTGDFANQNNELTNHGQIDTNGITISQYNTLTFDASGITMIGSKFGGTLKLCLMDQRDNANNGTSVVRDQGLYYYMTQQGSGFEPKLTIVLLPLTVTTQECINTIAERTTGLGTIVAKGETDISQHGHVWATSPSPTTADSKTENGAAPNLGQFSSDITGIVVGTLYYVRAYATDSDGTTYGGDVTITTDTTVGRRHLWIEQEDLHYFDRYGTERKLKGDSVESDRDILAYL